MRLAWMQQDLAGARRAATLLFVLLAGSVLTNIILATLAIRASGRERIVVLPPAVHRSFWVEPERVSREYLEQMGYFLAQLVLDVTPQSTDYQAKVLLQYASPGASGALKTALTAATERLKRDGAATVFATQDLVVDEATMRVGLRGKLTTWISDRRVSEVPKGYALGFRVDAGRILLDTFTETSADDPLRTRTADRPAAVQP